jgi:hypothetical protein
MERETHRKGDAMTKAETAIFDKLQEWLAGSTDKFGFYSFVDEQHPRVSFKRVSEMTGIPRPVVLDRVRYLREMGA